ncbi:tyrosine protein kinase transforming protein Abl, putative [Entamoeba invadens IP1]|uniref:Tyrosine protein kinase transforming protein Abl, putative n=1 Tax=Entamoeba invadens IP1 TaxID=370355 RepID=L7FNY4_ENTIV|nr:tyrosine protein kinase transforming protein Abl, putative [Entamoeba invadens IP1]ELP92536.1 tyrosine protein kinase transforming protein Abl, putative [Entamoeba invadens IP1]|eukprot:XP_004259307.1 tyrosine protein kinase transforming protein Abl, putative [Entamoeba invadens IP1]
MHTVVNSTQSTVFECETTHFLSDGNCESVIGTNINDQTIQNYKQDVDNTKYLRKEIDNNTNCRYQNEKGCLSCNDGYYLEDNKCVKCANNCTTCFNSTLCLTCDYSKKLLLNNKGECIETILTISCQQPMGNGVGCAICKDGYYYEQKFCYECDKSCAICKNSISCSLCADTYFYYKKDSDLCITYDKLIGCKNKTSHGCDVCQMGYYMTDPYCSKCAENCLSCTSLKSCEICNVTDYVLKDGICLYYTEIEFCTSAHNGFCMSCVEGKQPKDDGLSCKDKPNLALYIALPVVLFVVLLIVIAISIILLFFLYLHLKEKKKMINVCVFQMKKSNIQFFKVNEWLVSNKKVVVFENEDTQNGNIPVDKETRELLCVGNRSKNRLKIQFSVIEGCDFYEIRTEPKLVNLKSGEACEFEVFLKPLCSCEIKEKIVCVGLDIQKGIEMTEHIAIEAKTEMTTKLDYHELKETKKLGEGSFGIVYLGDFRGKKVAIKKLKEGCETNQKIKEFEKEVAMLDKFRSEYIVHFYGAVFIPSRICMVTEFAQFGSLNDLMKREKEVSPRNVIKAKLMLDMAKGISYLHNNGIVHRDIKPDNLLVFSLEMDEKVNAKMTDFGSARNINMLMTNMTFTKGIGTPKYMSPEVLNKEKYKMPSDIFSFAITMYECFTWKEPYPKSEFKFAWSVADFVSKGNHLKKVGETDDTIYSLLNKMWCFEFKVRIVIDEVVEELEDYLRQFEN